MLLAVWRASWGVGEKPPYAHRYCYCVDVFKNLLNENT
jgi:hypothetical protein